MQPLWRDELTIVNVLHTGVTITWPLGSHVARTIEDLG